MFAKNIVACLFLLCNIYIIYDIAEPLSFSSDSTTKTTEKTNLRKLSRLEDIFTPEGSLEYKSVGFLKRNLSVLMGIPTVKRPTNASYIFDTLDSLFSGIAGHNDTAVLVFIGQGDEEYFEQLSSKLKQLHPTQMEEGTAPIFSSKIEFVKKIFRPKNSFRPKFFL